jgi:hypothetical protein
MMKCVFYLGTGCNAGMGNEFKKLAMQYQNAEIEIRCWHKDDKPGIIDDIADYTNIPDWNMSKEHFDVAVGHSAGGFPLQKTSARFKLGINPFLTVYPHVDKIFHARDDWLNPVDLCNVDKVICYNGDHNKFPYKEMEKFLDQHFSRATKTRKGRRT